MSRGRYTAVFLHDTLDRAMSAKRVLPMNVVVVLGLSWCVLVNGAELMSSARRYQRLEMDECVCFSAKVTGDMDDLAPQETIVFGTVVLNIANAYNAATGIFTAPVQGIYQFWVTLLRDPSSILVAELIINTEPFLALYTAGDHPTYGSQASNTVIVQLQDGDKVFVRIHQDQGTSVRAAFSTFTGNLLALNN